MDESGQSGHELLNKTSKSFVANFRRATRVSAVSEGGEPIPLTQQALATLSGVGRSTIAKYISNESGDNIAVNPDLNTICRLADALNVSPAFLLMRPEDWSRLAQAIMYFSMAAQDVKFKEIAKELSELRASSPTTISLAGLKLAKRFNLYEENSMASGLSGKFTQHVEHNRMRIRRGILATSALLPTGELNGAQIPPLLSVCAIAGAHI